MSLTKPNYGILDISNALVRQAVLSFGGGLQAEATEVTGYDSVSYNDGSGNAAGTPGVAGLQVNLGMDFATGEHGGMLLGCPPANSGRRTVVDTLRGTEKYLYTNETSAEFSDSNMMAAFTSIGYNAGGYSNFNSSSGNNVLAFNTTNILTPETTAKSVTFDCKDNWGNPTFIGIRSIDFLDASGAVIPITAGFTAYATSTYIAGYEAANAFNTALSKTGTVLGSSWAAAENTVDSQRLTIVFDTPLTFYGIRVNNYHHNGTVTNRGAKGVKVQITDDTLTQLQGETYGDTSGNLKQYLATQLYEHLATDTVNDQDYKTETWHINPATGFGMCLIKGSGLYRTIIHPMGKKLSLGVYKRTIGAVSSWYVYSDKTSLSRLLLNTSDPAVPTDIFPKEPTESELFLSGSGAVNGSGDTYILYGWFGDDLSDLHPGMTGVRGSSACVTLTGGGTFDCGFEPETVIVKRADDTDSWYVFSRERGWDRWTALDLTNPETITGAQYVLSVTGTELTIPPAYVGDYIIIAFGKTGELPTGKSLQIKATPEDPFVASISDGFSVNQGNKDTPVGHAADVVYPQTEADGVYDILLGPDGSLDLAPVGSYVTDYANWKNTKLLLGGCTISDGLIVDIDEVAVGDSYTTPWFPVVPSTVYVLPNLLRTPDVLAKLQYASNPLSDQAFIVNTQRAYDGTKFRGGYTGIIADGNTINIYTDETLTPSSAVTGYYRMIVRRNA